MVPPNTEKLQSSWEGWNSENDPWQKNKEKHYPQDTSAWDNYKPTKAQDWVEYGSSSKSKDNWEDKPSNSGSKRQSRDWGWQADKDSWEGSEWDSG